MWKTIAITVAFGFAAVAIGVGATLFASAQPAPEEPTTAVAQAKQPAKEPPANGVKPRLDRFGDPLPEEALARFGTVRFRQSYFVNAFRYSPDGKTMAIAGDGRPLGLWDLATGKEWFQFDDKSGFGSTYGIAFSPDGTILAATRRNDVLLWDPRTGELIRELKGHTNSPMVLVFGSDGKTVVSSGHDKTIRFWDVATGQETSKLEKHTDTVWALALSSDGKLLASDGGDRIIRVWDMESRGLLKELSGDHGIGCLSFSPDGKQLVSAGEYETGYGRPCVVWDLTKGERGYDLDKERKDLGTAAFSPNGKLLAAGGNDGFIRLYEPSTAKEIRRWDTQSTMVRRLIFSKDGKTLAGTCTWASGVRFWDVETGKEIRPLDVHRSMIDELKLSPDGKSLWALGRNDRRVIRWDVVTAQSAEVVPIPPKASFLFGQGTLSPAGNFQVWRSTSENTIHVMDLKTGQDACEPLQVKNKSARVQFSPDGNVLAVSCDGGRLYFWKWRTDREPKPLKVPNADLVWLCSFTPDGKQLFIPRLDGQSNVLQVWDVSKGEQLFSLPGHNLPIGCVAISPNSKWLAFTNGYEANINVFDLDKRKTVNEIKIERRGATALAFSPNGRVLAVGEETSRRSDVKLIEFATGQTIATFRGHHSGVLSFEFTRDGRTLYSGGGDSTILQWDATARRGKGPSTANAVAAWDVLGQEASKAYPASWDLVDSPKEAVALLRTKIIPAKKLDPTEVQRVVDDLDAANFQSRQKASALLKSFGYSGEPVIRKLLETEKRIEVKERLQKILDELSGASFLPIQRAFQVLEAINNTDAKKLLRELADGAPESMLTREAVAVLKRMAN